MLRYLSPDRTNRATGPRLPLLFATACLIRSEEKLVPLTAITFIPTVRPALNAGLSQTSSFTSPLLDRPSPAPYLSFTLPLLSSFLTCFFLFIFFSFLFLFFFLFFFFFY